MKKYSFVKQGGIKDCGVACISMILKHYGGFINHERLCDMTHTSKSGTTAFDLVETLKKLGFESYGIHYTLDKDVDKLILPAIAHTVIDDVYNHFVVIYEIDFKKEYVIIADPASRVKKMSFEDFNKIFTNVVLIAYPIRKIESERQITIRQYLKKIMFNKAFINLLFLTFLFFTISFIYILLIKIILNKNINFWLLLTTLLIIIFKYILNNFKMKKMLNFKNNTNQTLMNESFSDILRLPYSYYRNRTTGEIISRVNDIDVVKDTVEIALILFTDIILTIITSFLLFVTNKILFLTVIFILILYLINYLIHMRKINIELQDLKQSKSLLNSYMTESVIGFESIKGQNLESTFEKNFKFKCRDYLKILKRYHNTQNNIHNLNDLISDLSVFIILTLGIILVSKNVMSYGDLLIFYTLSNYFLDPIKHMQELNVIITEIKVSLKRILDLKYVVKHKKIKSLKGDIKIQNLNFNLLDKEILQSINLDIKTGEKIMLVGHSGSGKSTILKLLKQYYKTNQITIGDKNISKYDLKNNITYISQNEYLFTDTLINNITMHNDVDKKYLDKVIKICELDELIRKNKIGLNMLIEENGFNLSGGEKQRIVLARALVNIKDYLFIDEGLSEVDISLERRILKNLFKNFEDMTIILVSHRNNNLDLFDKLIELDKGKILSKKKGG